MHKSYRKLFETLASSAEQIAERIMEYDAIKNDEQNHKVAKAMREDYGQLADRIHNDEILTKKDYAKLLVSITLIINQIEAKIKTEQQIVEQYKNNIIPKLDELLHLETNEEVLKKAEEFFNVKEKENSNN